jgi:hypothetical protein
VIVTLGTHKDVFTLAAMLCPAAVWTLAEGDVGQYSEADVALEDKATDAVIVLHINGWATYSDHRLVALHATRRED